MQACRTLSDFKNFNESQFSFETNHSVLCILLFYKLIFIDILVCMGIDWHWNNTGLHNDAQNTLQFSRLCIYDLLILRPIALMFAGSQTE